MTRVDIKLPGLTFSVNEDDHNPPHVHVRGKGAKVRINLLTLESMDKNTNFNRGTLRLIIAVVQSRQEQLMEIWNVIHPKR